MKAALFRENGGPEVLSYEDIAEPEAGPFDVVVKVRAAALNHLDLWVRKGGPHYKYSFPHITGSEGAGDVVRVGSCVENIKEGDAVLVTPAWSCNRCEFCLNDEEPMCLSYGMLGIARKGCFAEYVAAPAETIYPMPSNLSYEEAASIPLVFLTAWHMLISRARIKPGEDVLVQAAGSGVGIAAIQIAKLYGARVFATASTDEKLQKAKTLGADVLINYKEKDFGEEIRAITGKRGVDVIFEHTGSENWEKNVKSLARRGRLVTCGATSGYQSQIDIRFIYSRGLSILGSYMGSKKDMFEMLHFVRAGKLRPVIDSVFPLSELRKAEEKMQQRNLFGKIIVRP